MKKLSYLILLFIIASCSNNKSVFWCGDHACINKKEKEAYFKKTMIVEVKELDKKNIKNDSEIEKITQQVIKDEKKRIKDEKELAKQIKLEEKRRIKEEKELAKQIKLEEKRRIKEEKELAKQIKLEEKRRIKEEQDSTKKVLRSKKMAIKTEKKASKQNVDITSNLYLENPTIRPTNFSELVENITKKNTLRPYPDVNDIPN